MTSECTKQSRSDLDYMKFRRRLFARRDLNWRLLSGSLYERPILYVLTDPTDIDDLVWPSDICAIVSQCQSSSKNHLRGSLLTVHTKGVHSGFARLRTDADVFYEKPRRPANFISKGDTWTAISKGPSDKKCLNWSSDDGIVSVYDTLCEFDENWRNVQTVSIDRVGAIHCQTWPPEVAEWITRERKNGWPSRDVIENIVEFGCHLVAKPHQSNPGDFTQWRFSFSHAEFILANNWTYVQKYIYHVLRLIKSEVVKLCGGEEKTALCTYFFKTLMLWSCEQKPLEFWTDKNVETSIGELLCQMIEWLIERRCPNYFIPGNNMIDHLSQDDDLSNEISSLLHCKENRLSALLSNTPKAYPRTDFCLNVPNKALHYLQLHMVFGNIVNPLQPRMSGLFMNEITASKNFLPVLRDLHAGITKHLQLMISRKGGQLEKVDERELSSSALNSFALAIEAGDPGHSCISVSLSDSLLISVEKFIVSTLPTKRTNSTYESHLHRVDDYKFEDDRLQVENYELHILRRAVETLLQNSANALASPSFFISAAYRANFFYTGLRDYRLAVRQCDEAFSQFASQTRDVLCDIANEVFYFMLTNEWSAVFDEGIQTVLGFTALYRSVFKVCDTRTRLKASGNGRTIIVIRLCAMEFLCYVKCQCLKLLGRPSKFYSQYTFEQIVKFKAYRKPSMFSEKQVDIFSNFFLDAAFHASCVQTYVR